MQTQTFPRWVDVLFTRLTVRYGDAWIRKWDGVDPNAIKTDWQETLQTVFDKNPHAIAYGLQHLPADFPPNVDQFLRLCLQKPTEHVALPAPVSKSSKGFAEAILARIKAAQDDSGLPMGEQCARRLEAKIAAGQKLSFPQRAQLEAIRRMGSQGYNAADVAQELDDLKRAMSAKVAAYESAA